MPYTPYQSTWQNPYLPTNGPSTAIGQSVIPAQQAQLMNGWQPPANGITKLSGRESAYQYGQRMPPNSMSQALFDTNGKVFYIVTTDGAGMPTVEEFDFSPHVESTPVVERPEYVGRKEFDDLVAKVEALGNGIHGSVQPAATADGGTAVTDGTAGQQAQ